MSTYDGLFLRSTLGSTNTIPKPGAQSKSPDIIPYGVTPVADPTATFKDYGVDYGQSLQAGIPNYLYMRTKNYGATSYTEQPRLFNTPSSLLSFPSKWTEIVATASGSAPSITAAAGEVGILQDPFVWSPENPQSGWHYCLIGMIPTPGLPNPEDVLKIFQVSDLAALVAKNGGLAWRNISVVPTNSVNITFKMNYDQEDEGGKMDVFLECSNLPIGTVVTFSAGTPGTNPPFYLAPTTVSTGPSFQTGIKTEIPAHWNSDVYMTATAPPGVNFPEDAAMSIQVSFPVSSSSDLFEYAHTLEELGIPHPDVARNRIMRQLYYDNQPLRLQPHHHQYLEQLIRLYAVTGPTRRIVVGENTGVWKGGL